MSDYLVRQIEARDNIEVLLNTSVAAVEGEEHLESITMKNSDDRRDGDGPGALAVHLYRGGAEDGVARRPRRTRRARLYPLGARPDAGRESVPKGWRPERDPFLLETSVPGIFVAGDVRHGSVKRCASAVGEGSIAVQFVHQYMREI